MDICPLCSKLFNYKMIQETPDRPNIFLDKRRKPALGEVLSNYEQLYTSECNDLKEKGHTYPVTLVFLPVFYMSQAMDYLNSIFQKPTIETATFSAVFSGQDKYVTEYTIRELKKKDPQIRLILCTSIIGMGFDPENVCRIVHLCPPRNLSKYLQEIGRAGRRGQPAEATLYFDNRDIAPNLEGIKNDIVEYCRNDSQCLRKQMLNVFGFEKDSNVQGARCCSFCKTQIDSENE